MNRMWMGALCALVMMTGCMAEEDQGAVADDVSSQESAIDEAPAPDQGEELRRIHDYCTAGCGDTARTAMDACDAAHPFAPHIGCSAEAARQYCDHDDHLWGQCRQDAGQSWGECEGRCDVIFGGSTNGGSHLPGNSP